MKQKFLLIVAVLVFLSCNKKEEENPYDTIDRTPPAQTSTEAALPEGNFAWLHEKVFKPTCANSGCHDGTFEPEFRTITSSYNSLVNQPVIANDPANSFVHRVVPGNAQASWLHERLTTFVENTSGIMPLTTEPTSDWNARRDFYIQKITDWINTGAKDMYGNPAPSSSANTPPVVYGLAIYPHNNTTTPYTRNPDSPFGIGEIMVPATLVDVWILPFDDNAGVNQFASANLRMSSEVLDFTQAATTPFSLAGPITANDFGDDPNQFYYKATLDLSGLAPGSVHFLRTLVDDGVQAVATEIPNDGSAYFWYLLFSIKIQ